MNLLSPGFAFQYTVEAFLGTGDLRTEHFFQQVWEYREMLRDFLRTRDKSDPNSPQVLFLPEFMSAQSLEPNQIPHFRSEPLSLGEGVMRGIRPITILLLECFLSFFFAFWAFYRSDIAN